MDNDKLIDAVLAMSGKDPFALDQDEWSIVAKALAFEVQRQRNYLHNLREDMHKYEDCPSCPAGVGESHAPDCVDHPANRPRKRNPGPTGDFMDDLSRLARDYYGGAL